MLFTLFGNTCNGIFNVPKIIFLFKAYMLLLQMNLSNILCLKRQNLKFL